MKRVFLTIAASLLLVAGVKSQVDLGLDTWVADPYGSLQDPQGWTSFNTLSAVTMAQTVFKITNSPAFGTAAAKVVTGKVVGASVPNPFRPGQNFDTVGLLCLGTIHVLPTAGITFGQPVSISRPTFLSFSSKDSVVAGDSSFVLAYLTKWNSTTIPHKLDTIASGKWGESSTGSGWASHTITMNYAAGTTGIVPDSQQIYVSSSIYKRGGAKIGSKYYVDGFCWDFYAGVKENELDNIVSVFPNPASDEINFSSTLNASYVEVDDISGRKLGMFLMQNNKVKIQTEGFPPGFYIYNIWNDKREIVKRGKFEIEK